MAATRAEGQQQNDVKLGGEAAAAATTAKCARKQSTGASNSGVTGPNKNQHLQQQQQAQTQQQQAEQAPDPPPPDKGARGAAHHQLLGSYATATPSRVGADSAPAAQDHHDANYSSAPPPAHQSDQSDSNPTPQPPDQQSIGQHQPPDHYSKHEQQPRLAHLGQPPPPQQFQPQPRFLSGQSISQSTGPTPTLNQLLQASSPMHRFHTGYSAIPPEGYQQPWPPMQRPGVPGPPVYAQQPSQRPPQTSSPRLHPGPGGPSSPTPMSYQPYPQRYPSPARPHSPYGHHQLNSYPPQGNHPSNMYPEQRGWNQSGPPNPPPPPTNQQNPSSQSPQRALSQSPAPPPSASPQPQPAQSQNFHSMQQRSTTPNTQGIDSGELSGQNSNDSSNGPAGPGTPNSQGMRPTPSPTGSTGSRSMSPAVGQQNVQMPPRPSSSQSDGSGPARMSHSPMTTQGGYQQPLGPSPHMHNYKMNSSGPGVVQPGPGQTGLGGMNPMAGGMGYAGGAAGANQPGAGYPQGSYPPPRPHMQFPQGYPPQPANSQPPPNNQYQPARPNNLVQYPPYPHKMGFNSVPPGMPPSPGPPQVYGGPAGGGPGGGMVAPGMGNMGPPTSSMGPPPPSPNHVSSQPQSQPPAPSMPPSGGGGTSGPPPMQQSSHSHPPAATPPLSQEGPGPGHGAPSPMPPPSTTPNSHAPPPNAQTPIHSSSADLATESSNDSGITTTASGTAAINVSSTSSGTVTSVITTGPDGTSLDEGSQQSTLSNASAASGEDPAFTPKVRKDMMGGYHSHPTTPQSTVPSPSAASINSIHEEYSDMSSPGWPRTPASPVFNSHVPQDPYRSKKPDSLAKLYEMDDTLERRSWLDKLVSFMEERRTPITSCPTISKNPLDLFRLYLYVKERGGFMEVCKVTKNKTWKDIAGLLGIGASSSAAYTLRKHYTKHLLAYECHFDRGGVDPQPIINQVEAGSKKKGTKGTASVPSPGSSNSQDSFPAAGSSNTSMDGYGSYQSNYSGGAPGGPASEYTPPNRPPSQSSAPSPHQGMQQGNYQNAGSFQNYPQDQYIRPQGGSMAQPGDFNQPYSPRSHYPPYVADNERGYSGGNMPPNNAGPQDMYNRYGGGQQAASYPQAAPPSARNSNYPPAPQSHPPGAQQPPSSCQPPSSQASAAPTYSCPQDYYRQDQGGYGGPGAGQIYSTAANKNMPPPPPGPQQPRRHPDFAKDQQQYPQYNQQRPAYPGWPGATNQYNSGPAGPGAGSGPGARLQYPSQQPASTGPPNTMPPQPSQQQQQQPPPPQQPPQPPSNAAAPTVQQMQQPPQPQGHPHVHPHAHPQHPQQPPQQQAPAVGPAPSAAPPQSQMPPMPQMPPVPAAPPNAQQWSTQQPSRPSSQPSINAMPPHPPSPWDHRYPSQPTPTPLYPPPGPHQKSLLQSQLGMGPVMSQQQAAPKREMTFPPDSVEAVTPLHYKRRKLTRQDVSPVEAWRIMMALRSGLLAESCWALDVLNILLFDDSSIQYFGLANLPGLLDVLLEHFSRSLSDMFEMSTPEDDKSSWNEKSTNGPEVDLGAVTRPIDTEDRTKLLSCSNYTFLSRRGRPVKMIPRDEDLFVLDSKRQWDHQDREPETEPWQVDPSATKYIITCFQSEISSNTFARHLRDEKPPLLQKEVDNMETKDEESKFDGNANADSLDSSCSSSSASSNGSTTCPFTRKGVANDVVRKDLTVVKQNDKKKKTKSLSDVLSRIKREPTEMNDLTRELFEKKNDGSKRDCENDVANNPTKANNKAGERFNELPPPKIEPEEPVYTNDNGNSTEKEEETTTTTTTPCRNDTEDSQNEELKPERAKDRDKEKESKEKDKEEGENEGENLKEEKKEESEAERQHREWKEKIARLKVKDPAGTLKRRRISDYEDESYSRDEASLYLVTETQDSLARRCVCLSTILRNLTFIPGNEGEFAKNVTFLSILGKLLLLHHEHPVRTQKTRNYDREEDADFADSCSSLQGEGEWWWDFLYHIRENVLVMSANISGYMDLSLHPEEISRPVLDGLLHWAVCPAAHGQDPFPTVSLNSSLSPQRLALEALCKLCVTESNVDLVVATPPYSRLQRLCSVLTRLLCRSEEQPMREFAVNLLHFLSAADSGVARTIALQTPCVAHLVAFIEQAESSAIGVANQHGLAALRDNPESMGTSLDMLRRAAATLLNLARHPDNRTLLLQHESRLLALVMSQILDQQVAAIVARVLYQCSRGSSST